MKLKEKGAALGRRMKQVAGAAGGMALSGLALAQTGPDTSAATAGFAAAGTAIGTIGAAMVAAAAAGIVYRWVTAFLVK